MHDAIMTYSLGTTDFSEYSEPLLDEVQYANPCADYVGDKYDESHRLVAVDRLKEMGFSVMPDGEVSITRAALAVAVASETARISAALQAFATTPDPLEYYNLKRAVRGSGTLLFAGDEVQSCLDFLSTLHAEMGDHDSITVWIGPVWDYHY